MLLAKSFGSLKFVLILRDHIDLPAGNEDKPRRTSNLDFMLAVFIL